MIAFLVVFCIGALLFSLVPNVLNPYSADARCPNGYHKSPSGNCERVTHSGGLPRCPDGFHRSPDGDCERVYSGNSHSDESSESVEGDENNDNSSVRGIEETDYDGKNVTAIDTSFSSDTPLSQSTECKGSADCFRGIVTEIVDGDTLDVNNVRVRLAMVNTPEVGEPGYYEAIETTESECPVGSEALVDEDDGQKGGSFGRLIGVVYCDRSNISLNEILMNANKAVLYEDFCDVSEFANENWVTRYGC